MQYDPSARPTLRLRAELTEGWADVHQRRCVERQDWAAVQPLSHLAHPILIKSRETMGTGPSPSPIACSRDLRLAEIRSSQWRAAVWTDRNGVAWVVSAGLAKGGHHDHEDFYEALDRTCETADGRQGLLPTRQDKLLLLRETLACVSTQWQLELQEDISDLLERAVTEGTARSTFRAPLPIQTDGDDHPVLAEIEVKVSREDPDIEEIVITPIRRTAQGHIWDQVLEYRLLTTISPAQYDWDITGGVYSEMKERGYVLARLREINESVRNHELIHPTRSETAHYLHRPHIGDASVDGQALRALCGSFVVPQRDAAALPVCPICEARWNELPGDPDTRQ